MTACDYMAQASAWPKRVAVWLKSEVSSFSLTPTQAERLRRALPGAMVTIYQDEMAFAEGLAIADMAIGWRFHQAWIDAAPDLRWLATPSAGKDYFQVTLRPGMRITYGAFQGLFIAETVAGMVLAESRGLLEAVRQQMAGDVWPRAAVAARQRRVRGTHAVIVGFGQIGEWVGRLLNPLGVRVTGVRRHPERGERPTWMRAEDVLLPATRLDEVLPDADHVILVLPSSATTNGLFNASRLALLPPRAVLYNVGRGNAVDEAALIDALHQGRLRGACLDVFNHEPLPAGSPFCGVPNLYLMPHLSAVAPDYLDRYIEELSQHWQALKTL